MTEKNDLALFKTHCAKWVKRFGLYDWDVLYSFDDTDTCNGHAALNPDGRKAMIYLCSNRESFVSIPDIAKHECLEVLLADIGFLLGAYYAKDVVDDEIHKVINRLMVVL